MTSPPPALVALPRGEAHLWLASAETIGDPDLLQAYSELLSAEEQAQRQRYIFERHRHQCLVTRALLRTTLSRYASLPPQSWRFFTNEHGRPEIAAGSGDTSLRFNLSHTRGLIALVVVREVDVGVDVEDLSRRSSGLEIADRFFSGPEARDLRALPEEQQRDRFFDLWTLKEAYIKARGMGLALPLHHFSFFLRESGPAPTRFLGRVANTSDPPPRRIESAGSPRLSLRLAVDAELGDDPDRWQLLLLCPTPAHRAALALSRGAGPDWRVLIRWTTPLGPDSGTVVLDPYPDSSFTLPFRGRSDPLP